MKNIILLILAATILNCSEKSIEGVYKAENFKLKDLTCTIMKFTIKHVTDNMYTVTIFVKVKGREKEGEWTLDHLCPYDETTRSLYLERGIHDIKIIFADDLNSFYYDTGENYPDILFERTD